jgi:hypothetical protein
MPGLSTHGYIVVGLLRLTPLFPWARKRGPKAPWAQQKGWGGERKGEKRGGGGEREGKKGECTCISASVGTAGAALPPALLLLLVVVRSSRFCYSAPPTPAAASTTPGARFSPPPGAARTADTVDIDTAENSWTARSQSMRL